MTIKALLSTLAFSTALLGQYTYASINVSTCYPIAYMDFFGLENMGDIKWSTTQLQTLLQQDFTQDTSRPDFLIPSIVYQLKAYHPDCMLQANMTLPDTAHFEKLVTLYLKIRDIDIRKISGMSAEAQIDFIRQDFYTQVTDSQNLPSMLMTFDDGPLYGIPIESIIEPDKGAEIKFTINETIPTEFGELLLASFAGKAVLISKNKSGEIIWQKILTNLNDQPLSDIHVANASSGAALQSPIEYTSLATIAHLYAQGERLTLYLTPDGQFLFYYHSW